MAFGKSIVHKTCRHYTFSSFLVSDMVCTRMLRHQGTL